MAPYQKYVQRPGHSIAASVVLPLLDVVVVSLRFSIRRRQSQGLKMDDWLMIPALLLLWGISISVLYGVSHEAIAYPVKVPADFHGSSLALTTSQISLVYQIQWAYTVMLPLTLGCIKTSFLFFYLRVFAVTRKGATYVILVGMIVFVTAASLAFFLAKLFECELNFWAIWGSTLDLKNYCFNIFDASLWLCIVDFATDIIIISIPIPLIWRLHLSPRKKIAVSGVFLIGSATVIASLVRLVAMINTAQHGFDPNEDGNLVVTESLYWATIECGVGVLVACLPSLRVLFRDITWHSLLNDTKRLLTRKSSNSSMNQVDSLPPSIYYPSSRQGSNTVIGSPTAWEKTMQAGDGAREWKGASAV
ncbi:hypothetical protein GGR52DRAFT_529638 [Hypoxylon sp. FL1284]|nr:hypothetical protein GGR52DRAFT_529638 [Hypoxylon sp. FL1284]